MCVTGALVGGSIIGGLLSANSANKATKAQARAAKNELELQERIYDETSANFDPYRTSGLNALDAYNYELGLGPRPDDYRGFEATDGYNFAFDQGQRAIEGSAAATGNVLSGATLKALQGHGTGLAQQEHNNYLNRLSGQVNMGQAAAGNQAAAGQNYATGAGNAYANMGNAQSAGAIAQGNAWAGAANNALSAYMYGQMMPQQNTLFGGNSWG